MKKKKRSKNSISKEYDEVYAKAQALFDKHKPCNIQHHPNGKVSCNCYKLENNHSKLCCSRCEYLSKNGCRVKALDCKLWYCKPHPIRDELAELKRSMSPEVKRMAAWIRTPKSRAFNYI